MSQQAPSSSVPEMEHRHTSVPPSDGVDSNAPTDVNDDVQEKSGKPDDAEQATAAAAPSASVAPVAPDGGARAWMVLGGGFCTAFCTFGWLNSVGVFQEYYEETILSNYSAATVSWIPSLQIFFMLAPGPFVGIIYDKYGPRHILLVGSVLHVFGLMMTSISTQYYQLLLSQGVCSAIGVGLIFQPAINVIPGWFNKKRGLAYGLVTLGSSVGGVVFPIMLSRLIPEVGYGWAMRISAFMILGLLIVANFTIRAYRKPSPRPVTARMFITPWTELPFVLLALGLFMFTFGLYVPIDYIAVEAAAAGMSPHLVQYLVPILNAGSVFGRLGSGFVSDIVGRYNVFAFVCYLTGILALALWIPAANDAARIAYAVLFGFSSGAYVALIGALVVQISPWQEIGFRTGIIFAFTSIPGLVTNPISGAILGSNNWVGPKVFAGVFSLAGASFILMTRIRGTGFKLAVKY